MRTWNIQYVSWAVVFLHGLRYCSKHSGRLPDLAVDACPLPVMLSIPRKLQEKTEHNNSANSGNRLLGLIQTVTRDATEGGEEAGVWMVAELSPILIEAAPYMDLPSRSKFRPESRRP